MCLQFFKYGVQPLVVAFPNLPVALEPLSCLCERFRFETPRAALSVAATRDQTSALEHLQVLGNGRLGHGERLGQFVDRSLPGGQAGEDGPASGVGESGESGIKLAGCHYS